MSCHSIVQDMKIDPGSISNQLLSLASKRNAKFRFRTFCKNCSEWPILINSNIFCQQLDRLQAAIDHKWRELASKRGVVFQARPQTSIMIRHMHRELGWKIRMYPLYRPDRIIIFSCPCSWLCNNGLKRGLSK